MDIANTHTVAESDVFSPMTIAGNTSWREPDYAWTHSPPVEGFFVVLTIVIVPVAIARSLRRLRSASFGLSVRGHLDGHS